MTATIVDSARNANAVVVGQVVGREQQKLDRLEWAYLTAEQWSSILKEFKNFYVTVTYPDAVDEALAERLMTAKERCDMAISMDADLQDDVDAVDAMVEKYSEGCDIVYGVRSSRKKDTFFKRVTAEGFYRVMNFLGAETVFNHADYRLMSRRALDGLAEFREVNLFLRGIVPMIGYTVGTVEYERGERFAGESKYPLKKMLSFAMEGITSLSTKPIRYITLLGFLIFLVSLLMLVYSIVRWATGATIIGWASVICSVWAIGGLILLSLGVIGEYIGKIYLETKGRPRFLLREVLEDAHGEKAD